MTPEEIKSYAEAEHQKVLDARAPHEATFNLLRDYYKVSPEEVKQAISTIENAIEYNLKEGK